MRHSRSRQALAILLGGLLLAGCGQPATATVRATVATVGSGAACIPDLTTPEISLVGPHPGSASGALPGASTAQQVREGTVPAPPNARLVAAGDLRLLANRTQGTPVSGPARRVYLYATPCFPEDVRAYYVAVLTQNQWLGDFTPASGASAPAPSAGTQARPGTLFDLAALTTGRFVNVHPTGVTIAGITVLAAIENPDTAAERHLTFVEVIGTTEAGSTQTPHLAPTVSTTPNVGASAAPPPSNGP